MPIEMSITMGKKGPKKLSKLLKQLMDKGILQKFWPTAKSIIFASVGKRFKRGGGVGGKWAKLSPMTLMLRPGKSTTGKPLMNTGTLLRSVTGGAGSKSVETPVRLIVGTNYRPAKLMQEGGTISVTPRMRMFFAAAHGIHLKKSTTTMKIPARPFMFFSNKDKSELRKGAIFHLNLMIKKGVA